eukprot:UC1_evm2s2186
MMRFDAIRVSAQDGHIAVSGSQVTGPIWGGELCVYTQVGDAGRRKRASAVTSMPAGCTDVQWLGARRLLAANDDGSVVEYAWHGDGTLVETMRRTEHDDMVLSLAVSSDNARALSASQDGCVKLWDVLADSGDTPPFGQSVSVAAAEEEKEKEEEEEEEEEEKGAASTSAAPPSLRTFVHTTGKSNRVPVVAVAWAAPATGLCKTFRAVDADGCIVGWSTETATPTGVSYAVPRACSLAWLPNSDYLYACGTENGSVMLVDVRNETVPLATALHAHTGNGRRVASICTGSLQEGRGDGGGSGGGGSGGGSGGGGSGGDSGDGGSGTVILSGSDSGSVVAHATTKRSGNAIMHELYRADSAHSDFVRGSAYMGSRASSAAASLLSNNNGGDVGGGGDNVSATITTTRKAAAAFVTAGWDGRVVQHTIVME